MTILKPSDPFQKALRRMDGADKALSLARYAYDSGRKCFIWKSEPFATNDDGAGLTAVVDEILQMGWQLHSSAHTTKGSVGMGHEQVMFTFVRPT